MKILGGIVVLAWVGCGAGGPGGGGSSTGVCNICPSAKTVNTAACASEGATRKCKTALIKTVSDDACSVGTPATSHQACAYEGCTNGDFDCSLVAKF